VHVHAARQLFAREHAELIVHAPVPAVRRRCRTVAQRTARARNEAFARGARGGRHLRAQPAQLGQQVRQ
jgi:hypothetical protein